MKSRNGGLIRPRRTRAITHHATARAEANAHHAVKRRHTRSGRWQAHQMSAGRQAATLATAHSPIASLASSQSPTFSAAALHAGPEDATSSALSGSSTPRKWTRRQRPEREINAQVEDKPKRTRKDQQQREQPFSRWEATPRVADSRGSDPTKTKNRRGSSKNKQTNKREHGETPARTFAVPALEVQKHVGAVQGARKLLKALWRPGSTDKKTKIN